MPVHNCLLRRGSISSSYYIINSCRVLRNYTKRCTNYEGARQH